jgi:hypothetical protein
MYYIFLACINKKLLGTQGYTRYARARSALVIYYYILYARVVISPVYTRPLIQIRIRIKVIQFLCKRLNPLLIRIRIHVLMWIKSGLHILNYKVMGHENVNLD